MSKPIIICNTAPKGRVQIAILDGKRVLAGLEMPASHIGRLAGAMLAAAKQSSQKTGIRPAKKGDSLEGVMAVQPSGTSLTQGPEPGYLSLILHMGSARLAFRLKNSKARSLGQAMVTLSAPEDRPQ